MAVQIEQDSRYRPLLQALADGAFHSGEDLGERLGSTRAAVWKQITALKGLGIELNSVRGRGYQLPSPVQLLDAGRIVERLSPELRSVLEELTVVLSTTSTNQDLLSRARAGGAREVLLAEMQTAGRGRWGRPWHSPFGANLYLSLLWPLQLGKGAQGLSIAIGAAVAEALASLGAQVGLKWPNDLLTDGRKLGGILLELVGDPHGSCRLVAGIGLNVNLPPEARAAIDQPVADLRQALGGRLPDRNDIAAVLIESIADALERFEADGLAPFRSRWDRYDALANQTVTLDLGSELRTGRVVGVDEHGQLLINDGVRTQAFASGEARIRKNDLTA